MHAFGRCGGGGVAGRKEQICSHTHTFSYGEHIFGKHKYVMPYTRLYMLTFAMLLKFTRFKYFASECVRALRGGGGGDGDRCGRIPIFHSRLLCVCAQTNVRSEALLRLFDFVFASVQHARARARSRKVSCASARFSASRTWGTHARTPSHSAGISKMHTLLVRRRRMLCINPYM